MRNEGFYSFEYFRLFGKRVGVITSPVNVEQREVLAASCNGFHISWIACIIAFV